MIELNSTQDTRHYTKVVGKGYNAETDETPTYEEFQRCKHCAKLLSLDDAFCGSIEDVCNDCLSKEKLPWYCNECGHDWERLGIPMQCPACNSYNLDSLLTEALDKRRYALLKLHLAVKH